MSYEIIYKIFTIRKENKYIPFIVMGSNNCTEFLNGRERRERNLYKANSFFKDNKKEFNTLEELKNSFETEKTEEELRNGNIQGKYKTSKSILNNFIKKVINYHELTTKIKPKLISLYYCETLTEEEKNEIEETFNNKEYAGLTEEELKSIEIDFLNTIGTEKAKKIKEYIKNIFCYPYSYIEYGIEQDLKKLVSERKNPKTEYEIIKENENKTPIELTEDIIKNSVNKKAIFYNTNKNPSLIGKIKPVFNGGYGVFKLKSKRRYYYLSNYKYILLV